jgi:hypothetical protein
MPDDMWFVLVFSVIHPVGPVNVGAMICSSALSNYPLDINYKQKEVYLFNYLDEFDRDICALNLKANAAILWFLETKCINRVKDLDNDDEDDPYYEMSRISIPIFRITWRLDS